MTLPNAEHALVDEQKVREHLLSRSHPIGRFKAAFLAQAGFEEANWAEFISALLDLARHGEAVPGEAGEYGQKYLVSGTLSAVDGAGLEVWTVWILSRPDARPRLVTVYPR